MSRTREALGGRSRRFGIADINKGKQQEGVGGISSLRPKRMLPGREHRMKPTSDRLAFESVNVIMMMMMMIMIMMIMMMVMMMMMMMI